MKDLVRKLSNPSHLMLDAIAGMLSAVKMCLLLDKHTQLLGCDKDGDFVEKYMAGLVEVHVCNPLDSMSELKGAEELMKAALVHKSGVRIRRLNQSLDSGRASHCLPSAHTFQ